MPAQTGDVAGEDGPPTPQRTSFAEVKPVYTLRHYQREAVVSALRVLRCHGRVLLHAPTGAGKTRMAMSVVSMHMRERGPTMVLWLAPTSELIDQAANAFEAAWSSHGDTHAAVIGWWGEGERFSHGMTLRRNTMLVAGIQTAVQAAEKIPESLRLLREKATLVVFDEAHQSVAPTYRALVEKVVDAADSQALLLGLSATPGRSDESESAALARMYGDRKVGVAPGRNPVTFLVAEGYLARANVHLRRVSGTPPPSEGASDYTDATLRELGTVKARNEAMVALIMDNVERGHRRIIAFTPSVASAQWCADAMKSKGIPYAHAIYGNMPQASRDHIVNTYRTSTQDNPHPQVILNCRALTAGVDLPQTSAVVVGKPTKSHVLLQQMIGRALRGPKSGGNANADIWILADESYREFGDLAAMFVEWDNLWDPDSTSASSETKK